MPFGSAAVWGSQAQRPAVMSPWETVDSNRKTRSTPSTKYVTSSA